MKYLFIDIEIQDGERRHNHRVLHTTNAKNIQFAAQRYISTFWGESTSDDGAWWAWGGEISLKLGFVKELTKEEFNLLNDIFYNRPPIGNKFLYYVVENTDGLRTIMVYTIENNQPKVWFELECLSDDAGEYFKTNEEEIQEWLDNNGYGDSEIEMIQL